MKSALLDKAGTNKINPSDDAHNSLKSQRGQADRDFVHIYFPQEDAFIFLWFLLLFHRFYSFSFFFLAERARQCLPWYPNQRLLGIGRSQHTYGLDVQSSKSYSDAFPTGYALRICPCPNRCNIKWYGFRNACRARRNDTQHSCRAKRTDKNNRASPFYV